MIDDRYIDKRLYANAALSTRSIGLPGSRLLPGSGAAKQRTAGKDSVYQFPFLHNRESADQQVFDSYALDHRLLKGRAVTHGLRVKNNYIGICALLQTALGPGCGS